MILSVNVLSSQEVSQKTSPRVQQSRASGNDKQKSQKWSKMVRNVNIVENVPPPLHGRAICIDTISIQYQYDIDAVSMRYDTISYPKYPKIT